MASKIATFRLPENLIQEIRSRAEASGRDRTAVVIEALKQAFGMPMNESRPATVEELQNQLKDLEQKFMTLTEELSKLTHQAPRVSQINSISPVLQQTAAYDHSVLVPNALLHGEIFSTQAVNGGQGYSGNHRTGQSTADHGLADGLPDGSDLQELTARIEQQARIFDLVLSASPDPICVVDRVGRFTYANLALAQLFGLPQRQILGKMWRQLELPPELMESEPIDSQREVVFATRRPLTREISYRTNNGKRDYECILSPILGDTSNVEAVICTARDVTERNQVEESLRESESNYRHLFEYANDSIFIIDLSNSRILDANQNAARRLGYTRKELLRLKTKDIDIPKPPEHQRMINQQLQATGSIIFEHGLRRKDGTAIQVEISSRIIEYCDQLVSLSFVRDVTARKQAEERMRLLESAVENTQDGILITEAKHIDAPKGPELLYVNQAFTRITGYDLNEVLGRTPRLLQGPKTDRSQLDKIKAALQEIKPVQVELLNYRKDGSEFWVELNIVPIFNKENRVTHWVALQREITERKQAEAALVASKQQVSKILETISDGFFTVDEQWKFTYVNHKAEQILQKDRSELLGQILWEAFPALTGSSFEREFYKAVNQQVAVTFEELHTTLGKWFEVHAYPSGDGLSVVCNDITKRKQAQDNR
jgi:PAS domain S-box-containing protein